MNKIKLGLLCLFAALVLSLQVSAQVPEDIILSIKSGNSQSLSKYFNENIELVVLEKENVYSKAHAEQVVRDFFKKYPPEKFVILHRGGSANSPYIIGNLYVGQNKFRVYCLVKARESSMFIHQLRIEKSDE